MEIEQTIDARFVRFAVSEHVRITRRRRAYLSA